MRGRSGSLIPPFVMHAAYNGLLFAVFAIGQIAKPN
jgi:membrane protease YdiL (CAAX protease family)